MAKRNFLIEGVSCSGKTTVCDALIRRGFLAIHGDRELAYQGDPETGRPNSGSGHETHIWDERKVRAWVADQSQDVAFFCGGSRNYHRFIDLFACVFVLDIDRKTLESRLDARPDDEFGAKPEERALVLRLHETSEDIPVGLRIDATRPVGLIVDEILREIGCLEL